MKKIISVFVLMLCVVSSAFAACCDVLVTEQGSFGCEVVSGNANWRYDSGDVIQTVGQAYCTCAGSTGTGTKYYNRAFKCRDVPGTRDDEWALTSTQFCADSEINDPGATEVKGATYEFYQGGSLVSTVYPYDSSRGSAGGRDSNPCLKVYCKNSNETYNPDTKKCEAVSTANVQCKENNRKHNDNDACGVGNKCLQTGSNKFLYCYMSNELGRIRDNALRQNSCMANVDSAVMPSKPDKYYLCGSDGTWKEYSFDKCTSGHDFPSGCGGVAHCTVQYVDTSDQQVIVDLTGVSERYISNTGSSICVRWTCANGYTHQNGQCVANSVVKKQQQAAAERNKINAENKKKCEDSFGSWANGTCQCDANKNLTNETNVSCKCVSDAYERDNTSKMCKFTSLEVRKQNCEAASSSGAVWSGTKCECSMPNKVWSGTQCVYPDGYEQCQRVQGAMWDSVTNSCVCKDSTKELDATRTKCVDSEETIRKRKVVAAQSSITSAVGKLENIVDGLDVSKWKTEDGNFNTARLASDSIAGVVLGTAGGLITSSVVKKHQVEDGFDDLQCTIGGQTVANWGDEFQVGVR